MTDSIDGKLTGVERTADGGAHYESPRRYAPAETSHSLQEKIFMKQDEIQAKRNALEWSYELPGRQAATIGVLGSTFAAIALVVGGTSALIPKPYQRELEALSNRYEVTYTLQTSRELSPATVRELAAYNHKTLDSIATIEATPAYHNYLQAQTTKQRGFWLAGVSACTFFLAAFGAWAFTPLYEQSRRKKLSQKIASLERERDEMKQQKADLDERVARASGAVRGTSSTL